MDEKGWDKIAHTLQDMRKQEGEDEAFDKWLKTNTIEKERFFLFKPHNNYPYSREQLFEIFKKEINKNDS